MKNVWKKHIHFVTANTDKQRLIETAFSWYVHTRVRVHVRVRVHARVRVHVRVRVHTRVRVHVRVRARAIVC